MAFYFGGRKLVDLLGDFAPADTRSERIIGLSSKFAFERLLLHGDMLLVCIPLVALSKAYNTSRPGVVLASAFVKLAMGAAKYVVPACTCYVNKDNVKIVNI